MDKRLHFTGDVTEGWPTGRVVAGLFGYLVTASSEYDHLVDRTTVWMRRAGVDQVALAAAVGQVTGRPVRVAR